jgi:cysteine synthase A
MRYQSKLFNAEFLRSKGLPVPSWLDRKEHAQADFVEVETA